MQQTPQPSLPHLLCQKCNRMISNQNYLLHQARCKGNTSNGSNNLQFNSINTMNQSWMICRNCGYKQDVQEIGKHVKKCPNREVQCRYCREIYPLSLMREHKLVCGQEKYNQKYRSHKKNNSHNEQNGKVTKDWVPIQKQLYTPKKQQIKIEQQKQQEKQLNKFLAKMKISDDEDEDVNVDFFPDYSRERRMPWMRFNRNEYDYYDMEYQQPGYQFFQFYNQDMSTPPKVEQKGLSKQQMSQLPVKSFYAKQKKESGKVDEEDMCSICYCTYKFNQKCMYLPCSHKFHPQCIKTWLKQKPRCPICKKNVRDEKNKKKRPPWQYKKTYSKNNHHAFQ